MWKKLGEKEFLKSHIGLSSCHLTTKYIFSGIYFTQGVIHKPHGQYKVDGWQVRCPRLPTKGRQMVLNVYMDICNLRQISRKTQQLRQIKVEWVFLRKKLRFELIFHFNFSTIFRFFRIVSRRLKSRFCSTNY